jgi:hypothetical protein
MRRAASVGITGLGALAKIVARPTERKFKSEDLREFKSRTL